MKKLRPYQIQGMLASIVLNLPACCLKHRDENMQKCNFACCFTSMSVKLGLSQKGKNIGLVYSQWGVDKGLEKIA